MIRLMGDPTYLLNLAFFNYSYLSKASTQTRKNMVSPGTSDDKGELPVEEHCRFLC